jgi:5-methylcytosine-specific restriction endonuclease McrA
VREHPTILAPKGNAVTTYLCPVCSFRLDSQVCIACGHRVTEPLLPSNSAAPASLASTVTTPVLAEGDTHVGELGRTIWGVLLVLVGFAALWIHWTISALCLLAAILVARTGRKPKPPTAEIPSLIQVEPSVKRLVKSPERPTNESSDSDRLRQNAARERLAAKAERFRSSQSVFTASDERRRSRHIRAEVMSAVVIRDEGACVLCKSKQELQYDHILPFSRGGNNEVENIRLLCKACNLRKHNKIM